VNASEIHHITLQTGHTGSFGWDKASANLVSLVSPWLDQVVAAPNPMPLPIDGLKHYSGQAVVTGPAGALLVCIFALGGPRGVPMPLATLAVAPRPEPSRQLWDMICQTATHLHPRIEKPPEPWLATSLFPALICDLQGVVGLVGFGQSVAWARIKQRALPHGAINSPVTLPHPDEDDDADQHTDGEYKALR